MVLFFGLVVFSVGPPLEIFLPTPLFRVRVKVRVSGNTFKYVFSSNVHSGKCTRSILYLRMV